MLRQEGTDRCKLIATRGNSAERVIELQNARLLPWPFAVTHLYQRWGYKLRFATAASSNRRTRLVCTVADTCPKLAGNDRRNYTCAGLL
jgi:ABC-type taurine transport system ATPase subunit